MVQFRIFRPPSVSASFTRFQNFPIVHITRQKFQWGALI